jgi:hypothetical protein
MRRKFILGIGYFMAWVLHPAVLLTAIVLTVL